MIDNQILVYNNGEIELKVSVNKDSIWLNQVQISELFGTSSDNISLHLKNIYTEQELNASSTVEDYSVVRKEGSRTVTRNIKHYNLDAIISVGYRINSLKATKFRQWATSVLKNYIQNGYVINTHRITEHRLLALESDVATIKSLVDNDTLSIKQGIFYDGEIFDAYIFITKLMKKAKEEVVLVDNYIDDTVLTIFSKYSDIKFTIITKSISKQLKLDIDKYNKQYDNLEMKILNKYHDRFLIIDKKDAYHIGASLKDLAKKVFAFNKINIKLLADIIDE